MNNTKIWSTESDLSLLHLIAKVKEEERNLNLNQTYLSLFIIQLDLTVVH